LYIETVLGLLPIGTLLKNSNIQFKKQYRLLFSSTYIIPAFPPIFKEKAWSNLATFLNNGNLAASKPPPKTQLNLYQSTNNSCFIFNTVLVLDPIDDIPSRGQALF
jgi:hypothetical protein